MSFTASDLGSMLLADEIRKRAPLCFGGPDFRKVHSLSASELMDALEEALDAGAISPQEMIDVRLADVVVRGEREGRMLYLVLAVSSVVDQEEVERAVRWAGILRKALGETWPGVAGRALTEGAWERIRQLREQGQPVVIVERGQGEWRVEWLV